MVQGIPEGCGSEQPVLVSCLSHPAGTDAWRLFTRAHRHYWSALGAHLRKENITTDGDIDNNDVESILLSPYFDVPSDTCSFSFYIGDVVGTDFTYAASNGTAATASARASTARAAQHGENCTKTYVHDARLLRASSRLRLIVMSSRLAALESLDFAIRFQRCVSYTLLASSVELRGPSSDQAPAVPLLHGAKNRCSFEYDASGRRQCDWLTMDTGSSSPVLRVTSASACVSKGLVSIPRGEKHFAVLDPPPTGSGESRAYLVSPPLSAPSGGHVRLSLYYQMMCADGLLNVYLTPPLGRFDVSELIATRSPWWQVDEPAEKWMRTDVKLPVPAATDEHFHVSLPTIRAPRV